MKASSMRISLFAIGMIAASAGFSAYSQSKAETVAGEAEFQAMDRVMQANEIAARLAPIKSFADLSAYITKTSVVDSPLNYLSPAAKNRFLSSLRFNENGITSFSYADLESELTPSQIYELLSLFGVQRTVPLMKGARVANDTDEMIIGMPTINQCSGYSSPGLTPGCDHDGYRCVEHGTCAQAMQMICTSNC